ncbi:MAG: cytochrome c3 family protein [Desulfobulbaceae bacterium]
MRKYIFGITLPLLGMVLASLILVACGPTGQTGGTKTGGAAPAAQPAATQATGTAASPAGQDLYSRAIAPLTAEECGRCHSYQFKWLKEKGGKHQMDCTTCHEQFHAYNPRLQNWDAIMPKCQGCHEMPHGKDFAACMECHQQPHAPKVIQFATLEKQVPGPGKQTVVTCAVCHKNEGNEFAKFPSKHNTAVNCQGCHAKVHGTIPSCLDCHEPHVAKQEYKDCLVCHSPHSAANIKKYPENTPNTNCAACHDQVYKKLQANVTRHTALQCATCHVTHGQIPKCQDCHGEPHGEGLHKRFASCLDCHKDPHDMPVNKKK